MLKIFGLSLLFFLLRTSIPGGIFQPVFDLPTPDIESPGVLLGFNVFVSVMFTVALTPHIFRSTLPKKTLRSVLVILLIGIPILINQIEAFFFQGSVDMSQKELLLYSLGNMCAAVIFAFVVTKVFEHTIATDTTATSFLVGRAHLVWRIPLAAFVIYPFLYLLFGTLLFTLYEPVQTFYANLEMPSQTGIMVFQLFRGLLWMIPGMLTFAHIKGKRGYIALMTGGIFAIFMSIEILAPVDFMPLNVRIGHFVELFLSHFIWGVVMVYLLRNRGVIHAS